jgi:perosamine synthetase
VGKTSELALFGGKPAVSALEPYRSIGEEERIAVDNVMRTGVLSAFIGAWCDEFHGGPQVQAFDEAWAEKFRCRHAVGVNSNTTGLVAAMGAVGVSPGDEVIAPLFYGAIPVFVDIEPDTFCLDPEKVRAAITPKTRAILVVDLFGHPAKLHELRQFSDEKGIYLIEDAAQAPLATEGGRYAGTIGHIGVFSLNCHKHIHTGEGGVCVTDDDRLALRLKAVRNHGENIAGPLGLDDISNMVGLNFRMTELSAAIGIEQLKKLDRLVAQREVIANRLSEATRKLPGLKPPAVRGDCRHVYYVWALRYDARETGVSRDLITKALNAEGVPFMQGYLEPLYMLPAFQRRMAIGRDGWPFTQTNRSYRRGMCPVAERMYQTELLEFGICSYKLDEGELNAVIDGVHKVFENIGALAARAGEFA